MIADELNEFAKGDFRMKPEKVERQLGDDLRVCVGFEGEAFALQELGQALKIGDDAWNKLWKTIRQSS